MKKYTSTPPAKLQLLAALFAAAAGAPGMTMAQPVDNAIRVTMPTLPRIDGCMEPGGLVQIQSRDEPNSSPYWCGTPPVCLTVATGAFDGTSHHCDIVQYSRREPRGNPAGQPGVNGVRNPEDLRCEAGLLIGAQPQAGICPPVAVVSGTAWFAAPVFPTGSAMFLNWAGTNAVRADVTGCSNGFSASNRAPSSSVYTGIVYDPSIMCTVLFTSSGGSTATAEAWAFSSGIAPPPASAPTCPPPQSWDGSACVAPPPAPTPSPAPACPPGTTWNAFFGVCQPGFAPSPPPPAPPPPPVAACPAAVLPVPGYGMMIVGYSTAWDTLGDPIYQYYFTVSGTVPSIPYGQQHVVGDPSCTRDAMIQGGYGMCIQAIIYGCSASGWSELGRSYQFGDGDSAN